MSPEIATGCRSANVFVIADLHWDTSASRWPVNFDRANAVTAHMVTRWNESVSEAGTVYAIGDAARQ